jgi:hypothetical protein
MYESCRDEEREGKLMYGLKKTEEESPNDTMHTAQPILFCIMKGEHLILTLRLNYFGGWDRNR